MSSMLKIQTAAVAALQRTRGQGRSAGVLQRRLRLLAPTASSATSVSALSDLESSPHHHDHHNRRFYSQTCALATEKITTTGTTTTGTGTTTLPPNLMFDFKSSFAPQKAPPTNTYANANTDANTNKMASLALEEEEKEKKDPDEDELNYEENDDDDVEDDFYDDAPLEFNYSDQNSPQHRPVQPLPERLQISIRDGPNGSALAKEAAGTIWLDPTVFGLQDIRMDLIKQNVNYIRNKIRGVRKAKSKTISEKSGSGRKVRPQKGGGQARAGHSRPAHWRGGAKAHGPKNTKDYGNTKLNKRVKTLAMRSILSQKLKEGNLILVNHLQLESHKTGPWARVLEEEYGVGKALKKLNKRFINNNNGIKTEEKTTTTALILDHYLEGDDNDDSSTSISTSTSSEKNDNDDKVKENDYHASYHGVPINLWVASLNIPRVTVRNHRFLNVYDILLHEKLIVSLSALQQIEQKWREEE